MNSPCAVALHYVLEQRKITFDPADLVLQRDTPFMIQLDEQCFIFMILSGDEQIAVFSFVADMTVLTAPQRQRVYEDALILNHFKWENDIKFCLDDDKQYLMVWEVLPLYSSSSTPLGLVLNTSIDYLCDVCSRFQQALHIPAPRIQDSV